jgi:predicted DNA-binding transcriptional regulator YafY
MPSSRLLSILMLLQTHGRLTAPALARALEVSTRTILRDVDQLSAAGVPLWGERGRQGGFQLREGWSTQLTGLTEPESQALLLAGMPGAATDLGLGTAAASARLKMVASLPAEWRAQAERVGARLHVDPVDWYRAKETPTCLREMAEAVWQAQRMAVRYESWRGQAERVLEPLGLVLKAGTWYVVARSEGQTTVRTYRLAAVQALRPLATSFKRPADFDLTRYWQASSARFEADLKKLRARLRVSPRAMAWLVNARTPFVHAAMEEPRADGWVEVLLPMESVEHGVRHLLSFGSEVEVLEPRGLRQALIEQAGAVVARYAGS